GLDDLVGVINSCMGNIMNLVYFLQGDVIKVAGDALYCVFPQGPGGSSGGDSGGDGSSGGDGIRQAAMLAVGCALAVRDRRSHGLSIHAGVGVGQLCFAVLGLREAARWECLVSGAPILQVAEAMEQASSQEVVLHRACHALVADVVTGKFLPGGNFLACTLLPAPRSAIEPQLRRTATARGLSGDYFAVVGDGSDDGSSARRGRDSESGGSGGRANGLSSSSHGDDPRGREAQGNVAGSSGAGDAGDAVGRDGAAAPAPANTSKRKRAAAAAAAVVAAAARWPDGGPCSARAHIDTRLIGSLMRFVPTPVLDNVNAGSIDYMAELREVTTMFLRLDSYSPVANRDLCSLGPYFDVVARALAAREGFLRQFLVDDKGCVLIACWGVPSATHPDGCERAIEAATSAWTRLGHMGMAVSVGITTGRALCGNVGSKIRCEYAMIGAVINLAARLMAAANGAIMCDEVRKK
ncbi:unnamed protein product, partial [Phaeothamnion confervicola]